MYLTLSLFSVSLNNSAESRFYRAILAAFSHQLEELLIYLGFFKYVLSQYFYITSSNTEIFYLFNNTEIFNKETTLFIWNKSLQSNVSDRLEIRKLGFKTSSSTRQTDIFKIIVYTIIKLAPVKRVALSCMS